jgi:hypothetical protein
VISAHNMMTMYKKCDDTATKGDVQLVCSQGNDDNCCEPVLSYYCALGMLHAREKELYQHTRKVTVVR